MSLDQRPHQAELGMDTHVSIHPSHQTIIPMTTPTKRSAKGRPQFHLPAPGSREEWLMVNGLIVVAKKTVAQLAALTPAKKTKAL